MWIKIALVFIIKTIKSKELITLKFGVNIILILESYTENNNIQEWEKTKISTIPKIFQKEVEKDLKMAEISMLSVFIILHNNEVILLSIPNSNWNMKN